MCTSTIFITNPKYKTILFVGSRPQVFFETKENIRFNTVFFIAIDAGLDGVIYNGIPDWLYTNTPELKSDTLAFSPDGTYLAFLSFNDSAVDPYEYVPFLCFVFHISHVSQIHSYTLVGDSWKYPKVRSIRYPKEGSNSPNVSVYVAALSVLKFINKIQVHPPATVNTSYAYVGNMMWVSPAELTVTFTNRAQTSALTVLCRAPSFTCREVSNWYNNNPK